MPSHETERAWEILSIARRKNGKWKLVRDETTDTCKGLIIEGPLRYAEKLGLCINKTMGSSYQVLNNNAA